MSNFNHTKGESYSANKLNKGNYPRMNEGAIQEWVIYFEKVIQLLLTIHILKYPVAIQYTPIEQKFEINGPYGCFLDVEQSERIKLVLDQNELIILQQISDNDEDATSLANWVNSHSDISEEEISKQMQDFWNLLNKNNEQNKSKSIIFEGIDNISSMFNW